MQVDFDWVLSRYKWSLSEYKLTGDPVFKQISENSEKWIKEYLGALDEKIKKDSKFIDDFAKKYETTNPDLVKYKKEIAEARKQGPEIQDVYEGEKESQKETPVDETLYYTKAAVLGGILALGAVISFL